MVISYQYNMAENFENGIARVMKGDKVININKENKPVD
jgi:WG containing repeat